MRSWLAANRIPLRRNLPRAAILLALGLLYVAARLPAIPQSERDDLARRFAFSPAELPEIPGPPIRTVRPVQPSLSHIAAWISAVGAGVALADIDGDGLPNDACYVDTRTNQVIVSPVPDSGPPEDRTRQRYAPFALDFRAFKYDETMAPMGCLPGNFAEGAATDLLVYFWGRTPVAFLHKPGTGPLGAASFVAQDLVPGGARWHSNAAAMADVDGDGHPDLIIGNYFPDDSRLLDVHADGTERMQHSMSRAFNGGGPRLLLWSGATQGATPSVSYRDASDAFPANIRGGWTLAVGAADLDGDLLPELYFANDFGPDRLLHNRSTPGHPALALVTGDRDFWTPKSKTLGYDSYKGMGVEFADLLGRGLLDIFVSNLTTEHALEESNFAFINTGKRGQLAASVAPFKDQSEALGLSRGGWAWDVKLADFDNAGALEMVQATGFVHGRVNRWPELQELALSNDQALHAPMAWMRIGPDDDLSGSQRNPFFVRSASGVYYNIAPELGLEPADKQAPSRGIAIADAYGDGKLDFAVANQWGPTLFYRNQSPTRNRSVELHLRLPIDPQGRFQTWPGSPRGGQASRPAIGAQAELTLPDGRRRIAQVDGGNGHSGKRSPDLHFGLGDVPADTPLQIALSWRDTRGIARHARVTLAPGIHTILLGAPTESAGGNNVHSG